MGKVAEKSYAFISTLVGVGTALVIAAFSTVSGVIALFGQEHKVVFFVIFLISGIACYGAALALQLARRRGGTSHASQLSQATQAAPNARGHAVLAGPVAGVVLIRDNPGYLEVPERRRVQMTLAKTRIIVIHGGPGYGKTYLAVEVMKRLPRTVTPIWLDVNPQTTLHRLAEVIARESGSAIPVEIRLNQDMLVDHLLSNLGLYGYHLFLDDFHTSTDRGLRDFVLRVSRTDFRGRIVVVSRDSEDFLSLATGSSIVRFELTGLPPVVGRRLVKTVMRGAGVPDVSESQADALAAKLRYNPQAIAMLPGLVAAKGLDAVLAGLVTDLISDLVKPAVRSLTESQLRHLAAVAVYRRPVSETQVSLTIDDGFLPQILEQLVKLGLIRRYGPGSSYLAHDLVRDFLEVDERERLAPVHLRAARVLEQSFTTMEEVIARGSEIAVRDTLFEIKFHFSKSGRILDDVVFEGLARASNNVGILLAHLHEYPEAAKQYEEAARWWRSLLDRHPDDSRAKTNLASVMGNLGTLLSRQRSSDRAAHYLEEALRLRRELMASPPSTEQCEMIASAASNLAALLTDLHAFERARALYEESLGFRREVLRQRPNDSEARENVAMSLNNLGSLLLQLRDFRRSRVLLTEALEIRKRLLDQDSDNLAYRSSVAGAAVNLGTLFSELREWAEARRYFEEALLQRRQLLQSRPDHGENLADLAQVANNLGNMLARMADLDEALRVYSEALSAFQALLDRDSKNLQYRFWYAAASDNIANVLLHLGRRDEAKLRYETALDMRRSLLESDKRSSQYMVDTATTAVNLANLHSDSGRPVEARQLLEEAIRLIRQVSAAQPDNRNYRFLGAQTLMNMGVVSVHLGDHGTARACYSESQAVYNDLLAEDPRNREYRAGLASVLVNLADSYVHAGTNPEGGRRISARAVRLWNELVDENPEDPLFKDGLTKASRLLALFDRL